MSSVAFIVFLGASLFSAHAAPVVLFEDEQKIVQKDVHAQSKMMRKDQPTLAPADPNAYTGKNATAGKAVNVHLFYETKCPDCIEFLNGTLAPLWRNKEMKALLNVTMNPYGNAESLPVMNVSTGYHWWHPETTKGEWSYVHICQHGTDECLGNLIQMCAISLTDQENYMEFVFCMADKPNWSVEKSSYECMTQHNIDHSQVKECVESPQGNKLFADYGKITGAVQGRQGTPWVLINGAAMENPADLLQTVCTHVMIEGQAGPESCKPFQKKADGGAPAPAQAGGEGDFTVLSKLKKVKKELIALDKDHI